MKNWLRVFSQAPSSIAWKILQLFCEWTNTFGEALVWESIVTWIIEFKISLPVVHWSYSQKNNSHKMNTTTKLNIDRKVIFGNPCYNQKKQYKTLYHYNALAKVVLDKVQRMHSKSEGHMHSGGTLTCKKGNHATQKEHFVYKFMEGERAYDPCSSPAPMSMCANGQHHTPVIN